MKKTFMNQFKFKFPLTSLALVGLVSMKSTFRLLVACSLALMPLAAKAVITLNVDAAPNVYGSPNWPSWWSQTEADVAAGTFTDMRSGTYPGTHLIDPRDESVYSTEDLGQRLHWIYWLPGQTTAGLGDNFQTKWVTDWAGEAWTYDWTLNGGNGDWALDGADVGWTTPASWADYNSGVIGSFGFAWLTSGPNDTAFRNDILQNQTYATGLIRSRDNENDAWQIQELTVQVVPEPTTAGCFLLGLGALAFIQRLNQKRSSR
jgi:hypothetical protein